MAPSQAGDPIAVRLSFFFRAKPLATQNLLRQPNLCRRHRRAGRGIWLRRRRTLDKHRTHIKAGRAGFEKVEVILRHALSGLVHTSAKRTLVHHATGARVLVEGLLQRCR